MNYPKIIYNYFIPWYTEEKCMYILIIQPFCMIRALFNTSANRKVNNLLRYIRDVLMKQVLIIPPFFNY